MGGLPQFISFGEALTDLIRRGEDSWVSVPGGAPWNVARVMACFGVSSAFGGAIGRDCFSDVLYQAFQGASGVIQLNQIAGTMNHASNSFSLQILPPGQH